MTLVGIAVVRAGGTVFVVQNLLGRPGAAAPPAAPKVAPPTTAPPAVAAPTTTAPARARPSVPASIQAQPASTAPVAPSPWLALALEMTRGWERATG